MRVKHACGCAGGEKFVKGDGDVEEKPEVTWEEEGKHTLICIDPDAPDRAEDGSKNGSFGPFLHWLVTDAEKTDSSGKAAVSYYPPKPPQGEHRCAWSFPVVFLSLEMNWVMVS